MAEVAVDAHPVGHLHHQDIDVLQIGDLGGLARYRARLRPGNRLVIEQIVFERSAREEVAHGLRRAVPRRRLADDPAHRGLGFGTFVPGLLRHVIPAMAGVAGDAGLADVARILVYVAHHLQHPPGDLLGVEIVGGEVAAVAMAIAAALFRGDPFGDRLHQVVEFPRVEIAQHLHILVHLAGGHSGVGKRRRRGGHDVDRIVARARGGEGVHRDPAPPPVTRLDRVPRVVPRGDQQQKEQGASRGGKKEDAQQAGAWPLRYRLHCVASGAAGTISGAEPIAVDWLEGSVIARTCSAMSGGSVMSG